MLTVIFGAGASYDSVAPTLALGLTRVERARRRTFVANFQPPLGSQLFEDRASFKKVLSEYRMVPLLARTLRDLPDTAALESELDKSRHDPKLRREIAAIRYYLKRILWEVSEQWADWSPGETNYHVLLKRLKQLRRDEQVNLVTFNYDLLLDHAVRDQLAEST